jgi:WD40 repeat protein
VGQTQKNVHWPLSLCFPSSVDRRLSLRFLLFLGWNLPSLVSCDWKDPEPAHRTSKDVFSVALSPDDRQIITGSLD